MGPCSVNGIERSELILASYNECRQGNARTQARKRIDSQQSIGIPRGFLAQETPDTVITLISLYSNE
jgi:hypothetical protein